MRDLIVALDFKNKTQVMDFLDKFDESLFVKIGMELFYAEGPSIVEAIKQKGHKVFLDLKLHDIPNTVYSAVKSLQNLDVDMVDVHIAGGREMIKAARKALDETANEAILLGITMLTSSSEEIMHEDLLIPGKISDVVVSYAKCGIKNGLNGIVCSALEVPALKSELGPEIITVTPGIRPENTETPDDQKRVVTPKKAAQLGSTYIVVGRPITRSENPVESYRNMKKEFMEA